MSELRARDVSAALFRDADLDPVTARVIARVLRQLPPEVAAWVQDHVEFHSILGGCACPPYSLASERWTILLHGPGISDDHEGEALVGHEIAHALLDGGAPAGTSHEEMTAWVARERWGFGGSANGEEWAKVPAAEKFARARRPPVAPLAPPRFGDDLRTTDQPAPATPPLESVPKASATTICQGPGCNAPVPLSPRRGSRRWFCSAACRKRAWRAGRDLPLEFHTIDNGDDDR